MPPPLQLTDAIAEAICADIEQGMPVGLAAGSAGFTRQAVNKWRAQGQADLDAGEVVWTDEAGELRGGTIQARFVVRFARARAHLARGLIAKVHAGATAEPFKVDWRAAVAALETLMPADFGKKALELQAADVVQPEPAASEAPTDPGAVTVELVRCPSCGDDQLPGKRYCGGCGQPMAGT